MKVPLNKKTAIISIIILALVLNFIIFTKAYPETFKPQTETLARDFSAYYMGAWRLFNNPTQVYHDGSLPGDYPIIGTPQPFKYIPNFLIWFSPFLSLSYQNAINAFDILQFISMIPLAFFVYKLVKDKNLFLAATVVLVVLLQPILITPSIKYDDFNFLHYRMISLDVQTFSPSYLCGYTLANAHILQNMLLVGALYFGYTKKPILSALFLTFAAFDPRVALVAVPLLFWYNRKSLVKFVGGTAVLLSVTNLPFFFYSGIGESFLSLVV
ncbi:MAG TPA: hypothetical protein VLH35_00255, partial [Candidatus Acidoferrales bacterium]|nr:hypothetical protein [Candidatus Acidoferrales bacterium]